MGKAPKQQELGGRARGEGEQEFGGRARVRGKSKWEETPRTSYTLPKYVAPTINNSLDYDNWLSSIVADINANHPPFEASYNSNHIYLYLPTQFLNSTCACGEGTTDQVYIFRDRSGMENPVRNASIYCCKEAPSGCTLSLQQAQEDYETDLIGQQAWYDSQMAIWYNNCQDSITDSCSNALAAIDSIYLSEVTIIEHYWDSVITALSAGCGLWEADDTLQWDSPCDAVLEPFPEYPLTDDCVEHLLNVAWHNAKVAWEAYRDSVEQAFRRGYTGHCMQALEKFDMEYEDQEYHFTLYYYDQAGSLVKTVPPLAVKRLDTADLATVRARRDSGGVHPLRPWHHVPGTSFYQLATDYRYNSLDQPILQRSPDGGTTAFWYDELGRLVFSQNGRQEPNDQYSFTDYDALGRITRVGQLVNATTLTQTTAGLSSSRASWLSGAGSYREITSTYYDVTPSFSSHSQTELRNRVAAITFEQADDGNAATFDAASFYAYDIHGNVNVLWQYNQDLEDLGSGQGTRVLHYYYDLVSGNVRSVAYNPDGRDRYFHRYRYDSDNRITRVETWEGADWSQMGWSFNQWTATENPLESIEVWPWEEDASYAYYDHGPLARTELGDLKVQGMDYLYTIHGWIKGINSNSLDVSRDPGRDGKDTTGNANRLVGADALSYSLHYYDGDYAPINGTSSYKAAYHVSGYGGSLVDLWNGNIAGMVTTLQDIQTHAAQPQGAQYRYDQLNRIKEMQVWQDMDVVNNQWQSSSALSDYRTSYRYDANGNILNLNRNGHNSVNLAMDSLSYHYIAGTNQLAYVDDAVASGNYSVDIDDQAAGNYAYDATGNLIKDVAEEIDSIVWTAYGKVLRVVRSSVSSKPDLHFAYGPDGNRLSKKAVYGNDSTVWTFYVRDAQGNTMATYRHKESSGVLHLTDHVLYGSSRLGSHERKHVELLGAGSSPITARAGIFGLERGDKRYELSNHLGNVLTVVSDRRAKASCADTLVSGYWSDVVSTSDYYPFGMGMVERGDDGSYRYGFNGKEKDGEGMGGGGSTYDYGFRIYNPGLGKFLSVDPMTKEYPWYSPYLFSGDRPIWAKDLDGLQDDPTNPGPTGDQFLYAFFSFTYNPSKGSFQMGGGLGVNLNSLIYSQIGVATSNTNELLTVSASGGVNGAINLNYSYGATRSEHFLKLAIEPIDGKGNFSATSFFGKKLFENKENKALNSLGIPSSIGLPINIFGELKQTNMFKLSFEGLTLAIPQKESFSSLSEITTDMFDKMTKAAMTGAGFGKSSLEVSLNDQDVKLSMFGLGKPKQTERSHLDFMNMDRVNNVSNPLTIEIPQFDELEMKIKESKDGQ